MANSADVYISYAGNDVGDAYANSRDEIVKKICGQLEQKNISVKEYKTALKYKDNLNEYMLDIAYAKIIVLLVSDKYLKSEYCMYEATEILSRNKRELAEKIFPVVLADADIFNIDNRVEYIGYWETLHNQLEEKLKGKDPKNYMSLYEKGKQYREIFEGMDEFLDQLTQMCQLPGDLISSNNYQVVIDAIVKQVEQKGRVEMPVQVSAAVQNQATPVLYPQVLNNNGTQDVSALSKSANNFMKMIINKVDDTILDSENAKKEYIIANFEEISGEEEIQPGTLNFIFNLRTDKIKYEPYRQSLIISALSLGLIKKYDETKARLLIDFATDDDPVLSYRALAGVVLGLLDKEDYISDDIQRKLETLQDNIKIQRCLLIIFFFLGNTGELNSVAKSLQNIDYSKFEFFSKTQHWFQPFYEGNPILKENVPDKKFAKGLLESVIFLGLESTKYALALLFPTLTKENIEEFKNFCVLDKSVTDSVKTDNLKAKFLLELEVSKYVLEFYMYAIIHNNADIVNLIEDKAALRTGYLYKLVLNETYQNLLKANQFFFKKEYAEAAEAVKPVLEDQPNNIEALLLYGTSNYYAGNFTDVIPAFEKVRAKGIKEIQLLAILGDAYFSKQNFDKAIEAYEELLTLQDNIAAITNIGRSYQLMQNPDDSKALEYYLRAYELEPGNYYNLLLTGDCYLKQTPQNFEKAFEYYEKAFAINSNNIELLKVLTNCTIKLPEIEFEKCAEIYAKHIELEPQNPLPYMAMGDRLVNKEPKDYLKAFDYYEQAFNIDNTNINLIRALSDCITNLPELEFERCEKVFLKWIELEPKNAYPYLALGDAYINRLQPDYAQAFNYYYAASEISSTPLLINSLFTDASKFEGPDPEKLEILYSKYKAIEPGTAKPDLAMAKFYDEKILPEPGKAEEYYLKAFEIDPLDKELLFAFGKFYQLIPQPDYEKSFYYLNELLKLDADGFYVNFYLGWGNFVEENYADAKSFFEKCILTGVDQNIVYQNLAHIALIQHDPTAKELYEKSCALFTGKDEFYNSSMSDFKYIQKAGITKDAFEGILKEAMEKG